jgi:hypothetical protein
MRAHVDRRITAFRHVGQFHLQGSKGKAALVSRLTLQGNTCRGSSRSNSAFEQFMTGEQRALPPLSRPMTATFGPIHGLGVRALGAAESHASTLPLKGGFAFKISVSLCFQLHRLLAV